jgi:itaconyl-CoA hydratase
MKRSIASHTSPRGYFEDFEAGARMRHARRTTISEGESHLLTKLVMNTADGHFNATKFPEGGPFPNQLVFGLLTGSMVIGLATQDTAEQALAEIGLDALRFLSPVVPGDTLTAYSEVVAVRDADREDAGIVRFKHWGVKQDDQVVFEGEREVLLKRRSHWADR